MIGTGELILIFGVTLLLFGGKRLPELARSLGIGIKEFKRACTETEHDCQSCKKEEKCCSDSTENPPPE